MVKRVILGRSGEEKIVDLITAINDKASAGHTRPAGDKVLDEDEDFIWTRPDGTAHSVRDIDAELEGAQGRIDEAEQSLADSQVRLNEAEQQIQTTQGDLNTLETVTLPGAVSALEQADAAAQKVLTELDSRLTGVDGPTGDLSSIRESLTEAVSAVESAAEVARTANEAANAASQAALEAAGIAASKGRVIIQETEPVGEDRNAANIWIKPIPDDPATEIEEKAITYVYLEASNEWVPTSSDELAQAAQNALDAREAAQQAKQRADTAIANAATAQSAAEEAQRTANTATTDAREAHNEAVAAREAADAAMTSALNANLVDDPSFEALNPAGTARTHWTNPAGAQIETENVHGGKRAVRHTATGSYSVVGSAKRFPITPNRFYKIGGWVYVSEDVEGMLDGSQFVLMSVRADNSYVWTPNRKFTNVTPGQWTYIESSPWLNEDIWRGQEFVEAQFVSQASLTSGYVIVDDVFLADVTDAVKAQQIADAAQARADEAMTEASAAKGLAEEAVREVGDTVRNTVIEYAVNTSETSAPTSGWSTSTPTRTPGSFVWMRTIVTYADGDTSTTSPALLTGNDGAKGDKGATGAKGDKGATGAKGDKGDKGDRGADGVAGKDGVGLAGTALTYALSTSGTTAPSSGWTATPPTPVKGRYLWTRTIWTYTDSSKETGYSVAYLATDGAKGNDGVAGKDGVGIKSTAITYAASSSGTTAPSSGWSSQPPAASAGQYVWTKTVWTYTDNSTETGYSVGKIGNTGAKGATGATGAKGDKGDTGSTGAQGVSVSSVTPFFRTVARTAGAPAQPSGMTPSGWVTTEPAWSSNTKLYRAERIVYSNGTVSWTVPTLVAAYEGIVQVQTSVNGKNSITRSTSNASGSGVVAGDAWYKVDSNGDTMAMWIWNGSKWVASKVRNEMIDTIDVNKLKVHDSLEVVGEAVINKLWADGIAAKAITTSRLTVANSSESIIPNSLLLEDQEFWRGSSTTQRVAISGVEGVTHALRSSKGSGTQSPYNGPAFPIIPGGTYLFECWMRADVAGSNIFIELRDQDGNHASGRTAQGAKAVNRQLSPNPSSETNYLLSTEPVPTAWTKYQVQINMNTTTTSARVASFYFNHTGGSVTNAQVWVAGMSLRPMASPVLIENGAITTEKLTVTGDMSAAIVKAMSVSTKKLVVTKEAILNHATLIGQTVVDDINVQGKLIGKDGVFTGTVDFANINVTGEVLASEISGEYLYGTVVEGGQFVTQGSGGDSISISSSAFNGSPGLAVSGSWTTNYVKQPGIGPQFGGVAVSGGRGDDGFESSLEATPYQVTVQARGPLSTNSGDTVDTSDLTVRRDDILMRAGGATANVVKSVHLNADGVRLRSRNGISSGSEIVADDGQAALGFDTDGTSRSLIVDSAGVWVRAGVDHYNLEPRRRAEPFNMPSGWTVDGDNYAEYTITLGVCHWDGVLKSTRTLSAGWSTIGYAPAEARPRNGDQLRALPTSSGKTVLGKINASTGKIEIWLSQSSSGIFMHFSPFSYLV